MRERRYWAPHAQPDPSLDERRALDRLEGTLEEVLRDQVVADVPVGAFLSGGIDSSLLVAHLAARGPLDTFTIGFDDRALDEAPFARAVAEKFGTRHHELNVGAGDAGPELVTQVPLIPTTALVLVAHDYKYDLPVLRHALSTPVGYIGLLGSTRRGAAILNLLREDGVSEEALARVRVPIGLDLGAQSASEIALSILAEALTAQRNATGMPISEKVRRGLN